MYRVRGIVFTRPPNMPGNDCGIVSKRSSIEQEEENLMHSVEVRLLSILSIFLTIKTHTGGF